MSNIKVVKINKISEKKTKKNRENPDLEYLKNIIRNKETSNKNLSKILSKNEEIEALLSKRNPNLKKKSLKKTIIKLESTIPKQQSTLPKQQSTLPKKQLNLPKQSKDKEKSIAPFTFVSKDKVKENGNSVSKPKKKKSLPKSIINLRPVTRKDLNNFFRKCNNKKKKIISANIRAPKLKKKNSKKNSKKNMKKNVITNNPYSKIIKQVIKKNNKKIDKKIDKLKRNELITKLIHLDLINKNTKAPLNILQDIYKIYQITNNSINIKK
jgi:hypothetical protein